MNTHRFLVFFAALPLLMTSCVKEPEAVPSYSQFIVNPPQFTTPGGSKLGWASYGLVWETGDYLLINGKPFEIFYNTTESKWFSRSLDGNRVNRASYNGGPEGFSVVYAGQSYRNIEFNTTTGYYDNVEAPSDGTFYPLAGHLVNNNITLTPCCCVIRVVSSSDYTMSINVIDPDNFLVSKGTIDPVNACFVEASSDTDNDILIWVEAPATIDPYGNVGSAYYVLPMTDTYIQVGSIQFYTDDGNFATDNANPDGLILYKGMVYTIDLTRTAPNAK